MTGMIENISGLIVFILTIAALLLTYHKHMQAIWKDIAEETAEEMFEEYVHNCEYRVHTEVRTQIVVDETKL